MAAGDGSRSAGHAPWLAEGLDPAELRARRRALGLSQAGLAKTVGVAPNTVARWERGELRVADPSRVRAALGQLEADAVARHSADACKRIVPSHLPTAPTLLIGRDHEVTAARQRLLAPYVRLLTFTGPAGTGKTRLALAVAAGLGASFADGVHFVDLAPIREPALVASAIAFSLGIRDAGDQPLRETLLLYLQSRQHALVLDNFEQVVAAAPLVAELLTSSPGLKVVVTSRERLHVSWEHEWPVPPLELPPANATDRDSIAKSAAVALFIERARALKPGFALTDENAGLVRDICSRLEGLPLAIELAAAATRMLPLAAIQERLNQRLQLLTGGPRDAPVRHHTLRAAVAWSYGLLPSDEQAMFRALSVFVGGFTLEAAEAIVGAPVGATTNVLEHMRSLIDKSLILPAVSATADARPRFRMLETIREFGLEQLSTSGEFDQVQERHARLFLRLVGDGGLEVGETELRAWLDRVEEEYDNLRAVLLWSTTAPEGADAGPRLAAALMMFWNIRGHFSEAREWYDRMLAAHQRSRGSPAMRVRALWSAAFVAWRQGDYEAAGQLTAEAVALGQHHGGGEVVMALAMRGLVAAHQSRYADAHASLDSGGELASTTGRGFGLAWILAISGVLAYLEGKYALAKSSSENSLRMCRELRAPTATAMNLDNLGSIARRQGEYQRARSLHEESLAISQALGDRAAAAQSLANLGHVARAVGDIDTARTCYGEALQIRRELGDRRGAAMTLGNLGALAQALDEHAQAQTSFDESLAAARAVGDKRMTAAALYHLATTALARGDLSTAAAGYLESLQVSEQLADRWGVARSLEGCATILCAEGRLDAAHELCLLADAQLESLNVQRPPAHKASYEQLRASISSQRRTSAPTMARRPRGPDVELAVARARALLQSVSAPAAAAASGLASKQAPLSLREREVAMLVARGLTNREIAAELVIADRTADTHVSNVLSKLGMRTRSQIAAWVAQRDDHAPEST